MRLLFLTMRQPTTTGNEGLKKREQKEEARRKEKKLRPLSHPDS
jgi:hypothetical protein